MKKFTFIRETSNLRPKQLRCCWRQLFYAILFIVTTVLTGFTLTAQNLSGTVPVLTPIGGFGIDGEADANFQVPGIGDWFYNAAYPGSGGGLFDPVTMAPLYPAMTYFLQDAWGTTDPTIFTSSNKINDNPNTYTWGAGMVPNKNEIQNVGVHFAYGDPSIQYGVAGDLWAIFAADRQVTNGAAYIDFAFLQKSLTMTGTTSGGFVSEGTQGGRTVGDLLVTLIFTNGGTSAEVQIRTWQAVGAGYEYVLQPNSNYIGSIFVTNNNAAATVPFDVYGVKPGVYVPNQWVEGAVNLTQLLNFGANPCAQISTLFVRTKTSQSVNAELKDFPVGLIQLELGAPEVTVNCPGNMTMPACSTQEQINTAFAAWKTDFSYAGGVPPIVESYAYTGGAVIGSNLTGLLPPDICGGTVSITYTATDFCEQTDSCTATFTVTAPAPLVISDVQNMSVDACDYANQAAVNAAFATWLQGFTVSGGCNPQGSYGTTPVAPLLCTGGYVDVTYSVTDMCGSGSDLARFTLTAPPAVTVSDVQNMSTSACLYANQAAVNAAFNTWLAGFTTGGGCNPVGSFVGTPVAPDLCGGSTMVTYNVTDLCDNTKQDVATFTITAPPAVTVSDVQNMSTSACLYANQAAVNAAFNTWLAGFTTGGGCNPIGTFVGTPVAPDLCGGSTLVTYNVTDVCDNTKQDVATFTITAPPAVTVSDVQNMTTSACLYANQAAVNATFNTWLAGFTTGGGCNPIGTFVGTPVAPDLCGGSTMVTYNVTDVCDITKQDVATFTITAPPALVISDVQDLIIPGCTYGTQGDLDAAFALWLEGFTVTGGCDPQGVFAETYTAPDRAQGGFVDVVYNVTDLCETGSDTARFTVEPCLDQFCSYTQGYYGNPTGIACDGENTYSTYGLIEKALDNYPGDVMRIGAIGHSILIAKTMVDINKVIEYLPGGKASYELSAGNIYISNSLFKDLYTTTVGKNNTTINNTLLAQTITLGLNLGMDNDLGAFTLMEGTFATADLDGGCGSTIAKERYCDEGMVYNEYEYYTIMGNIAAAASNVYELFGLANAALGNADGIVGTEQGISLADIAKAVDMINNAFDECRMFMGYGVEPLVCEITLAKAATEIVKAVVVEEKPALIDSSLDFTVYPVPFEDVINVQYRFEYDTDVTIQVFNLQGGLIYGVVDNMYNNGEMATKQINLARTFDQALIIRLTTNKEKLNKNIVAKSSKLR